MKYSANSNRQGIIEQRMDKYVQGIAAKAAMPLLSNQIENQ
jgi:hypothetical protein